METLKLLVMNWRDFTHPWAGGAEVHIHELAKRWVKLGHEVTLLCGEYENCLKKDEIDGVEIIRTGSPYTVYLNAMKEYLWNLRKRGYDCVIDDINGVPFFTPTYVKGPKLAIIHHFVNDVFFKELPLPGAVLGYMAEKAIRPIYRNMPFVVVSESTKTDVVKSGISARNIKVIKSGVDCDVYKPSAHTKSSYPQVVYLGRVRPYKKVDHLIKATKLILDSEKVTDVKLVVAGMGDYRKLKKLMVEHNVCDFVDFYGRVSEKEKIALLDRSWVYVTASCREGWGLTVTEANACGTPAVAYNVPGLRDSIIDGKTGILVDGGNVDALAEAIVCVLQDTCLRLRLSENALKYAKELSWEKTAEQFITVLKGLCS